MQSKATTVAAYLKELPAERRTLLDAVRKVILANLDRGIEETMNYGMIGYVIPHSIYPAGYHCDPSKPYPYGGLASQKNYCSLYLMPVYNEAEDWFRQEWQRGGKKLNMGKCCIRFNKLEDLDLEVIAKALQRFTIAEALRRYESLLGKRSGGKPAAAKQPAGKKAASQNTPGKPAAKRVAAAPKRKPAGPKAGGESSGVVKSAASRPVGSGQSPRSKAAAASKTKAASASRAASKSGPKKSSLKSRRK